MTQIGGFIQPTRRPGALGVHSVDHFAFSVPDLKIAEHFYRNFGLEVREEGGRLELYTQGHPHRWTSIGAGPRKALGYISLGIFEEDYDRFKANFERLGIARTDPPPGMESNGLWVRDCDGIPVELKVAEKSSPSSKSEFSQPGGGVGVRSAPLRGANGLVRPRRMAHLLVFVRDLDKSIQFYAEAFGMRLSDRAGGGAFMHGIHGSDHHMLAFGQSDAPGIQHCSWDVGSVDDVGAGAMQMAEQGYTAGWGLGRHVLGSNFFHYVRDPWGSWCEYSADIDYIPADLDWEGRAHPPENSFFLWGPEPPAEFHMNFESPKMYF
jgi:catechol 2,3-dioxygenase